MDETCVVCGLAPCVCPPKVRSMQALTQYNFAGAPSTTWLRFKQVDGQLLLGCDACIRYAGAGHRLHGRQALGRFESWVEILEFFPADPESL